MCIGIALPLHDLPETLIQRHRLGERIARRDPESGREVQFLYRHPRPILPVWIDRQLCIVEWGSRDRSQPLPRTGWCRVEDVESGLWQQLQPDRVHIPALLALERGVWFVVEEGIQGLLVRDRQHRPHVYILTEPASYYYRIMTRNSWMPVLLGRRI